MRLEEKIISSTPLQYKEHTNVRSESKDRSDVQKLQKDKEININEIEKAVSELNEMIKPFKTNLKFQLHDELNEYYVSVIDPLTNEIIKEIPPKQMLDKYAAMAEFMGILLDEKI